MPKLVIEIDHEFQAGPAVALDGKSGLSKALNAKKLKELLADADPADFSLCVAVIDPKEGYPVVDFEMTKGGLKKGGTFEFAIDEKTGICKVHAKGEIASAALRAGVAPSIQKMGKKADLRLQAFNYKGGEWSGFKAPIQGQDEEDWKTWYQIKAWTLK
jgi:hypothetical protein